MTLFLQSLIIGLCIGAVYGVVALGFVLIYKSSQVLNIAQGELVMVGAFICFVLCGWLGLNFFLSAILTLVLALLLGFLIERLFLRPLVGQPLLAVVMMTIAIANIANGLVMAIFGPAFYLYPQYLPTEPLRWGNLMLAQEYFWGFIISMALLIAFVLFFRFTRIGVAMRAAADEQQAAQSLGINVNTIYAASWGISCLASAVGGIILGSIMRVSYTMSAIGMKAIPAVILGGLESIPGAIVGGITIGALETVGGAYLEPIIGGIKGVIPYIILLLVIIIKPYGLWGLRRIERI